MFTTVDTVGDTESKLEIKCLETGVIEEVPLNHTKVLYFLFHSEFYSTLYTEDRNIINKIRGFM